MPATDAAPIDTARELRRALAAVSDMRRRLAAAEEGLKEPVAIVGMACRFPGAPDLAAYWQLLAEGRDAIAEVPRDRWDVEALYDPDPDAPGKMSSRWGGFVADVDRFDAAFFGISPREAMTLDPQQRLLLQVAWHALEDAGLSPDRLQGSPTGVYVGLSTTDYARVLARQDGADWIDSHASLGNSAAVAAGRLSYSLGLQGPSMVVDTACSSSLVAVHLAVQALRNGEARQALAAGVNLILTPELTIGFSKARMMAADGRCKTFDAAADGYVRGEGCGVVVLKRLADALADGDRIHAVVLGSAVNQDGRSNGLTAPNGPAQTALVRAALANARVTPDQVGYIEAHGTGTPLGDPIEIRALGGVFGDRAAPLAVGSVKTNIGHLEAAAGIAGLIKAALALGHRTIPAHLHFHRLNPHIAADGFRFDVPVRAAAWTERLVAGVSAFGFSGTNGHVVLGVAPEAGVAVPPAGHQVLPLSARDEAGLATLRSELAARLARPDADLAGLAAALGAGRAHHPHRLAVAADSPAAAHAALETAVPARSAAVPTIAFLFTGQGCQYPRMARGLMHEAVFRAVIDRCDRALAGRLGATLAQLIAEGDEAVTRTDLLQPLLFAIEVGIAALWRSWGIEAGAVLGHSVGEIAAACHAGVFSIEDGIVFIAERGRLMEAQAGRGGMATAFAGADAVAAAIAGTGAVIAGLNAPGNTVIAGSHADLATALQRLGQAGIEAMKLEVATAFHSAVLDPCLDGIAAAASGMAIRAPHIPIASNLTGQVARAFDAAYWRDQARSPVRFAEGLAALAARGCRLFIEVGPQPVLAAFGRATLPDATFLPSIRRGMPERRTLAETLAALYVQGAAIDWAGWSGPARRAQAPLYPFRRDRFWPDFAASTAASAAVRGPGHPLLGVRLDTALDTVVHEATLSTASMPFLADHVVFGEIVVPGAMHAVLGLIAAGRAQPAVADLVFARPLSLAPGGVTVQTVVQPDGGFSVHARAADGWLAHATGRHDEAGQMPSALDLGRLQAEMTADEAGPSALFAMLAERGILLGDSFRGLSRIWRGDGQALAEVVVPDVLPDGDWPIHPAALDACFQLLGATFSGEGTAGGFLPLSVDRVTVWQRPGRRFFCHARIGDSGPSREIAVGHFLVADAAGRPLIAVEGLQIKRIAPPDTVADALLAVDWVPAATAPPRPAADWAQPQALAPSVAPLTITAPESGLGDDLEDLAAAFAADAVAALGDAPLTLSPPRARLWQRVRAMARGGDGAALAARLRDRHPGQIAQIDLVARCGAGIAGVLRGSADPLDLLFGDGGGSVYGGAGLAATANAMAAAAIGAAVARRGAAPAVIEIGAGTGATTEAVLAALPPEAHYLFTDISAGFLGAAEARFARPGFATAVLDIEQPVAEPGSADIVVAANVLHATADIRQTLGHVRDLLVPGGLLVLVESTLPQRWWDIVFGLTDGWWRFADTGLRPDHPLLSAALWQAELAEAGFAEVATVPVDGPGRQSVILARAGRGPELLVAHGGEASLADEVAGRLEQAGRAARAVTVPEALARLQQGAPVAGVACLTAGLKDGFDLVRAMVASRARHLWLVTRGAAPSADPVTAPEGAALWGLGKVASLEHGEIDCRRLDLDPDPASDPAAALAAELQGIDDEAEIAWRGGERVAARLVRHPLPPVDGPVFDPAASYLITGAYGGLGLPLARWLVERGARHLVLVGRRAPAEAPAFDGVSVQSHAADVADAGAMAQVFAAIDAGPAPLKAVFHLAGSVADGALVTQDWDRFASVLPAKADAALLLHELTRDRVLDHFVLFSTSAALIGNPGQANHAAANACLDALAAARRASGLPGLSINWGAWGETGAVVSGDYERAMAARGVRAIGLAEGFDALARAMMQRDRAQLGMVAVDWPAFLAGYGADVPPFLAGLVPAVRAAGPRGPARPARDFRTPIAAARPEERRDVLARLLREEAADVLGLDDPDRLDDTQALNEVGLDSLLALELRNRLAASLGTPQPATLLFNYPSVAALTDHVAAGFAELMGEAAPQASAEAAAERQMAEEVLGMSDADIEAFLDEELRRAGHA